MLLALQRILLYFPPRWVSSRSRPFLYPSIYLSLRHREIYTSFEFDQYRVPFLRMRIDGKQKKHCQTPNSKYDPSRNSIQKVDPSNRSRVVQFRLSLSFIYFFFLFSNFRFISFPFVSTPPPLYNVITT